MKNRYATIGMELFFDKGGISNRFDECTYRFCYERGVSLEYFCESKSLRTLELLGTVLCCLCWGVDTLILVACIHHHCTLVSSRARVSTYSTSKPLTSWYGFCQVTHPAVWQVIEGMYGTIRNVTGGAFRFNSLNRNVIRGKTTNPSDSFRYPAHNIIGKRK